MRDHKFWSEPQVVNHLNKALTWMSGDNEYAFTFVPGRSTVISNLFDREEFLVEPLKQVRIALFSGGLDSLAGVINELESTSLDLYLVSHISGQPGTIRTQNQLMNALRNTYGDRVSHFKFRCSLTGGERAKDENQRTRAFLYTSIAFALASALKQTKFSVYENGVTAFNFPKREDMGNARASRTTHPKTIHHLQAFFSLIGEQEIKIETPLLWKTKTDILNLLQTWNREFLISSAVSCSKTFRNTETTTHCGQCSQCIDRRIAVHSACLDDYDHPGLYTFDFLQEDISDGETRTLIIDYIRWANRFASSSIDRFYNEMINEIVDVCDYVGLEEDQAVEHIYQLHYRHGEDVKRAIQRIVDVKFDPFGSRPQSQYSFLNLIFQYEHQKEPVIRLVNDICGRFQRAIPIIYQKNAPPNENDLNDKISGILSADSLDFAREHPSVSFAQARAVPDHSKGFDLLVEAKYIRNSTTPSVISEGIAADLTKYPEQSYVLFVVYDPHRQISEDHTFKKDFEAKRRGKCTVLILR